MNIDIKFIEVKDDYFDMKINGVSHGTFERSQLRQLIEEWDKQVN